MPLSWSAREPAAYTRDTAHSAVRIVHTPGDFGPLAVRTEPGVARMGWAADRKQRVAARRTAPAVARLQAGVGEPNSQASLIGATLVP